MRVVAIIPARGGSKRLPRKNVQPLGGRPLVGHTIEHARRARCVERTLVSTEDSEIAEVSRQHGAEVVPRPPELANDRASSESALLHVLSTLEEREGSSPELVVFLQCTSPLRQPGDIDAAVRTLLEHGADSLVSVTPSHALLWRESDAGPRAVNYDPGDRPRSQDLASQFRENGSIYVLKPWVLKTFHNRIGGKLVLYPMDRWSDLDVDSSDDLDLCRWVLERQPGRADD